jgi:predicted SnoaL-like aldol condensation-catalyzing enzyme
MKKNYVQFCLVAVMLISVVPVYADAPSDDQNKAVVTQEVIELVQNFKLEMIPKLFAADYFDHTYPTGDKAGYNGVSAQVTNMHQLFTQLKVTIDEMTALDDIVLVKNRASGIASEGTAAGQKVCTQDTSIFRLKDGKITEHWDKLQFLPNCDNFGAYDVHN